VVTSSYGDLVHLVASRPRPGVVLLEMNRPESLNAANAVLHKELSAVWRLVDEDETARVSVITGAGSAFSAGGDFEMLSQMTSSHEAVVAQWNDAALLVESMLGARKPIVSAVNGVAVGAGLAVALLADVSVVGEGSRLSDGHARLGVAAGDHACLSWPLLCGMAKAKYYLMTGEFISGVEAERIGLVSFCVPDEEVLERALQIAERLAAGSALAVQGTRRALNGWLKASLPVFGESLGLEMLGFLGPDAAEGLAALREHRQPSFPSAAQVRPDQDGQEPEAR
jgi:enoyl-CoA hydratase